ncbi:putative RNA-directed DNA polymerase [Helianthus annuus]|nr:putative RNA-directed DNA polymerase [Helianthus annuus]
MNDKGETSTKTAALHPVYTVNNIQNKVRVLDGTKVTYSSWVKLFQLNARGYKVLDHIDGTKPPGKEDPNYESWMEIDAIVLQWIYGSVSDEILVRILEPESTALEAWGRVKSIFLNNKGSRAAALEHAFTNLTLKSMPSLQAYCQKLKEIADQLSDVESPVSENRLVIQLVRGLPPEYDTIAAQLNQTLPSWEVVVNLLDLEERRQSARETPVAAAAIEPPAPAPEPKPQPQRRDNGPRGQPRYNNQQRRSNGYRPNRGPSQQAHSQPQSSSNQIRTGPWFSAQPNGPPAYAPWWASPYGPPATWTPPPCPYPTQQGWATPYQQGPWQPNNRSNSNNSRPSSSRAPP